MTVSVHMTTAPPSRIDVGQIIDPVVVQEILETISSDVIDRWARALGQIDLARYRGVAVGPGNPVDAQIIVGGAAIDPRDRGWALDESTDSVAATATVTGTPNINVARYGGVAVGPTNPVDVKDIDARLKLEDLVMELRKLNTYMALVTDTEVKERDVLEEAD